MKLLRPSCNQPLQIDEDADKLSSGGEGTVYRIEGGLVAKIYHKPFAEHRAKIGAMLQNPPSDDETRGHRSIAWPVDMLLDADRPSRFRGYLMPHVDTGLSLHQVAGFTDRLEKDIYYTNDDLHVIALNMASAFRALHQKGYIVGDVNDNNVMVNERGLITVIDTDSFQVPKGNGSGWFRCRVGVPEFTPPELQLSRLSEIDRREEHDLFGLGVLLFKLLMMGYHPFNGDENQGWTLNKRIQHGNFPFGRTQSPIAKPPMAPPLDVLGPELRNMFVACFAHGARDPGARPRASDWHAALKRARGDLTKCPANPNHRFNRHLSHCPWCEIRNQIKFKNGDRLDYFPPPQGQVPLQLPGGLSQKSKTLRGPAPRPVSSGSSVGRPQTTPAPASSSSTPLTSSGPSLGYLLGQAIGSLLVNMFTTQSPPGSPPGVQTQLPQPELRPGHWQCERITPAIGTAPVLVGFDGYFAATGSVSGTGVFWTMGHRVGQWLTGSWRYDPCLKVLTLRGTTDGSPWQHTLAITAGGNDTYLLVEPASGVEWQVRVL